MTSTKPKKKSKKNVETLYNYYQTLSLIKRKTVRYNSIVQDGIFHLSPTHDECDLSTEKNVIFLESSLTQLFPKPSKLLIIESKLNLNYCQRIHEWSMNLTHLDLSSNDLGPSGLDILCNSLNSMYHLVYLNLSSNKLLGEGRYRYSSKGTYEDTNFLKFLEKLKVNKSIKYLDLTNNYLGGIYDQYTYENAINRSILCERALAMAICISQMLLANDRIVSCDITNNYFPCDDSITEILLSCIRPIRSALGSNTGDVTLVTLPNIFSLCGNYCDHSSIPFYKFGKYDMLEYDVVSLTNKSLLPIDGKFIGAELRLKSIAHEIHKTTSNYNALSANKFFEVNQNSLIRPYILNLANNVDFGDRGVLNLIDELLKPLDKCSQHLSGLFEAGVIASTFNADVSNGSNSEDWVPPMSTESNLISEVLNEIKSTCPAKYINIRCLNLSNCGLTSVGIRHLKPLLHKQVLLELDVSDNPNCILVPEQVQETNPLNPLDSQILISQPQSSTGKFQQNGLKKFLLYNSKSLTWLNISKISDTSHPHSLPSVSAVSPAFVAIKVRVLCLIIHNILYISISAACLMLFMIVDSTC